MLEWKEEQLENKNREEEAEKCKTDPFRFIRKGGETDIVNLGGWVLPRLLILFGDGIGMAAAGRIP